MDVYFDFTTGKPTQESYLYQHNRDKGRGDFATAADQEYMRNLSQMKFEQAKALWRARGDIV